MPSILNPPKQDRSRKTLERIVRASIDILDEDGLAGLTVQAIVQRARASVGSFYARFSGKEDLIDYLGERVWREAAERWDRAMAGEDWSRLDLQGTVRAAVRLLDANARSRDTILRALGGAAGIGESAFGSFQAHVLEGLEGLLVERLVGTAGVDDPRLSARLGLRAVLGALATPLDPAGESPEGDTPTLTAERRLHEAERILSGYLTGEPGGAAGDGAQVDFFDIWG